jgi:hypothetical protein
MFEAEESKEYHLRNFWMCETGTGQQVAVLLDCYVMMFGTKIMKFFLEN